ncbi:MAG: hypothetical protein Q8M06_11855 [Methanobacteriaceae archaeon]|nr:hypothetical protein [Methanobacteriaceae archaeon]
MIKYVKVKKIEIKNGPLSTKHALYFIDPELRSEDFDFVESELKNSFTGFVEFDLENCKIEYENSIPYIKITIKTVDLNDVDTIATILKQTRDWFIDHYNQVILINLENKKIV